jgi:Zn-dependent protease with chaperone function
LAFVTPLVGLGAIVLILGAGAGPLLGRSKWCQRLPWVAELAWLGVLASTLTAVIGIVVVVSAGRYGFVHRAAEWLVNCWHHHHDGANSPASYALNALLLGGSLAATVMAVVRYRRTVRQRRRHQEALQFVVRISRDLDDVCVLDHPLPVVYCVPSRRRPIVVSSGALDRLEGTQLQAVLAHERAHLRHRHHLLLAVVDALAAALFWLPTFRRARGSLPILLEMAADDAAARRCGRDAVSTALRKLAISPTPAGGLAARGSDASQLDQRLNRLETSAVVNETRLQHLTWATAAASAIVPFAISAAWIAATPLIC